MEGNVVYKTSLGSAVCGDSRRLLTTLADDSVNLVITSPPFALQRQKSYGNVDQDEYVEWLLDFARLIHKKLRPDGSFVIDLGGAYVKGFPVRSLYNFRLLLRLCDELGFFLAEDFYWFNPAKLPTPIEWVNKRKVRAKDAVNTVWWLSKSENPKADISKVLVPYSDRMKKLLADPQSFYRPKVRPSGHDIGSSFARDNGGAIPSNLLQIPNTESNGEYVSGCELVGADVHPARFPSELPTFFVRFLTAPGDLVLDVFAGSNTTGAIADKIGRRWLAFEERRHYLAASVFRFLPRGLDDSRREEIYRQIAEGIVLDITEIVPQTSLQLS